MSGLNRAEQAAALVAAGSPGVYTLSAPFSGKATARLGP